MFAKRNASIFLCLSLAVLSSACSSAPEKNAADSGTASAPSNAKVKLKYWTPDRGFSEQIRDEVDRFNKTNKDNIEVELTIMAENYPQSVDIAFSSNQAPDIIRVNNVTFMPFLKKGYLDPLDSYIPAEMKKKFESVLAEEINTKDGKLYSLPNYGYTHRLVYNKELFEKAGIQSPPKTLDELVAAAKKITEAGKGAAYGFSANFKSSLNAIERSPRAIAELSGYPGYGYDFKSGKYDFNGYKPIIEAFRQMKKDGSFFPGSESLDIDPLRAQFAEGKIGMYLSISAEPNVYKQQFPAKIKWDAAMPPTIDGNIRGAVGLTQAGSWLSLSSKSAHKAEAWKFLQYLYSDEILNSYYEKGLGTSLVPFVLANAKKPQLEGVEGFLPTKYDTLQPAPPTITVDGMNYGDAFLRYILDGGDLNVTIADLNNRYNQALDKARQSGEVKLMPDPNFDPVKLQGKLVK
ncbi:ABC transporter substrate-binding protein [Paenibacillus thalictri]|uniref:Sugar ABC transporter substrate-binding protein n=1 Tax=Paenibacillus thalictri TaxID=2527873 RepID=A0A4Q9DXV9_9BACL|nr:sugar ABC transporter substrate-binding protein [Paenibacillus thalictri]TBL81959.1 sugar ABC transporter substrate-binding protein [Paenibacillus thalictri]